MNSVIKICDNLRSRSSQGFILLGSTIALFIILSVFSIFLIRVVVKENQISSFNLADIRTRNLSQSGLDHGIQLFKTNTTPYLAPVSKNLNNGQYTITYDPANNENNSPLPYSHYAMINSSASINDATRNTRLFVSSYPDAFNLAFFGNRNGIPWKALNFDGNDQAVVPDNTALRITGPMTVEAWFRVTTHQNDWVRIVGKGSSGPRNYGLWIHKNGHFLFQQYGSGGSTSINYLAPVQTNQWYHMAGVRKASGASELYINGQLQLVDDSPVTTPSTSADPVTIGYAGFHTYHKGQIDEVKIWNVARTQAEIQSGLYNKLTGNEQGLVAYWDFDEGTGNIAYDKTGNGHNANRNTATWTTIADPYVGSFSQSGGTVNGDIYYNGNISGANLTGTAYTSTGSGGTQHPEPLPVIPLHNSSYFTTLLSTLPEGGDTGAGGSEPDPCPIVDFENGAAGWTEGTISGINTWNISNSAGNGANLGSKAYGAPNSGSSGMEHSYIESPVFDASAGGNLIFDTWMCNETGYYDREHVRISYNGGSSWQTLVNYTESFWNTQSQWITHTVNIPASSGTANTKIRFEYDTIDGCCGCSGGWFIDNIQFPPTGGCEQTASEETSGGGSEEGAFTLQYGENTNNSTRSWNFNLSGDAESDDQITITKIWVRGDFSGSNENLSNVTIGGHNFGTMYGAGDDGNWDLEFSGSQNVNMSGTNVSASVYPSSAINFTPSGASYWWEIKVEFYQEPEEETGGGSSVLTLNSSNITLYNEYVDSTIQNGNDIIFNNCTVNGPGKILASGDITFNSTTLSGNIEIISNSQISVENGSTLGTGISNLNSSVILYSGAGLNTDNSTIYGLSINKSGITSISNNTSFYGAIYSLAHTCNVSGSSSIVGSLVSAYGLSLSASTISKGSLPPIFGTPYGFQNMIIPGSYLEY